MNLNPVRLWWLCCFLAAIVGCAQLGIQKPRNLSDSVAYGYASLAAVRSTAAQMVQQNVLTASEGSAVLTQTDQARALLDSARLSVQAGDAPAATQALSAATAILSQLQAYLQSKQGKTT